jgi:ubiquinone/menaquinone biosynthesis C-methylase UbiE
MVSERRTRSTGLPQVLLAGVEEMLRQTPGPARILDLGGGTGGLAVRLAADGHDITVVDPSPDALAALARRADEAGAADRVRGVQGDAEGLGELVEAGTVDLVLCHGVLEVVDDPQVALRAVHRVLTPAGRLSLLLTQRRGAVLARVGAGHLRQALRIATDPDGRWGAEDPLRRRFDPQQVLDLLRATGFEVTTTEGVRVFADLVPRGRSDSGLDDEPVTRELVAELEAWAAKDEGFRDVAGHLHLHARVADRPRP